MLNKTIVKVAIPVVIGALALTGCAGDSEAGDGGSYKIAFQGPLSGDNTALGENEDKGVRLAIDQANAKGDLPFKLEYLPVDDQGLPEKATAAAQKAIDDPDVMAVVGPAFSGPTNSAAPLFGDAGLTALSASATNPTLTEQGFKTFLRGVPNDSAQGAGMATYYAKKLKAKTVYLVDDKSDYGVGLATVAEKELKAAGVKVIKKSVPAKTPDYSAAAKEVVNSKADALIYAGYYQDGAPFAKKLDEAGYKGAAISGDGTNDVKFIELAGEATEGWYLTCPCTDANVESATKEFTTEYKKKFKVNPGTYSAEAYDLANMIIQEMKKLGDKVDRQSLHQALQKATYKGLTKEFSFDDKGELKIQNVYLYQVKDGKIEYQGAVEELAGS
ncbi:branched-chain amino acid ABC transporter substrate-binding protein [Streptomyces sp. Wb2n-11]|uniref:branched-chain amino acid ABC transporter substrate-binding protein n=1 Tax=Streptomyces sp. Wb2n-11 TaxID=1030533 RepID=UPI000A521450|nr:branched-chain amino acid ABC transporter substrate-binding protein [Streptomyces sp. Wb2n-11]